MCPNSTTAALRPGFHPCAQIAPPLYVADQRISHVITLRQERGYSAANYDGSAVKHPKTLRRQFGKFYDGKKVRNNTGRSSVKMIAPPAQRCNVNKFVLVRQHHG
jgi:hypothetical protein